MYPTSILKVHLTSLGTSSFDVVPCCCTLFGVLLPMLCTCIIAARQVASTVEGWLKLGAPKDKHLVDGVAT